jgi:hypothetical protein
LFEVFLKRKKDSLQRIPQPLKIDTISFVISSDSLFFLFLSRDTLLLFYIPSYLVLQGEA